MSETRAGSAVLDDLRRLADEECENGMEAVGETCSAAAADYGNIGDPDYPLQHWCGPCIAKRLLAKDARAVADTALGMALGGHTPGPWGIVGEKDLPKHDDLMIVAFQVAGPGEFPTEEIYICNVGSDGGQFGAAGPVLAGDKWPVSLANARLIAAAPDLLAALKTLLSEVQACTVPHTPETRGERVAAAALANAEGRS